MRKRKGRNRRRKVTLYRRTGLVLLMTFMYVIVFVAPIFLAQYREADVSADIKLWQASLDAVTGFIQIFCLLMGLTLFRFLWVLFWPLLCILTSINNYMFDTFHTQVSKYAIAVLFEPKAREAESLFTPNLIIMLISGLMLGILGNLILKREKKEPRNFKIAFVSLAMSCALITINQGSMSTPYPPYNFLTSTYQLVYERYFFIPEERKDISKEGGSWSSKGKTPLVVVVVIGESARGDHFSINGYERETTPLLQKRKNLINFKETVSCGVWTRVAVPCLMTRATIADKSPMYTETSFISIFRRLGFHTAWLSTQGKTALYYPVTPIAMEAEDHIMLEEQQVLDNTIKDEQLLPLLDKQLENTDQPLLIVLHTYGSHWQYAARYTKPFERYAPVCATNLSREYDEGAQVHEIKDCYTNHEALVNSYDNSILYTDYILDQVISRLESKNALFLYTSDHGESLGEHGRFLHGHEQAVENRRVPMFWWASDDFIAANTNRWQALIKKNSESSSHDVIFHSILDCSGVSFPLVDPHLSLCNSEDLSAQKLDDEDDELGMEDSQQPSWVPEPFNVTEAKPSDVATQDDSEATDDTDSAEAPDANATKSTLHTDKNSSSNDEKILLNETKP